MLLLYGGQSKDGCSLHCVLTTGSQTPSEKHGGDWLAAVWFGRCAQALVCMTLLWAFRCRAELCSPSLGGGNKAQLIGPAAQAPPLRRLARQTFQLQHPPADYPPRTA